MTDGWSVGVSAHGSVTADPWAVSSPTSNERKQTEMNGTQVSVGRAPSLYGAVRHHAGEMDSSLQDGWEAGLMGVRCRDDVALALIDARVGRGFRAVVADLLTPPEAQHKLSMAFEPSYGLTLAHADLSGHEACPWRTPSCSACCVVANGNGRYDSVQRAWLWRTDFLLHSPVEFAWRLGWELGRAVRKWEAKGFERILFRPNVNSDFPWHKVLPFMADMADGFGALRVVPYGYTKDSSVLLSPSSSNRASFNEAYSWNERSVIERVREHLENGGKVAVVTDRRKGQDVDVRALRRWFGVGKRVAVADADATDEWMLARGAVIGDLTAKGKARSLIGVSDFVVCVYGSR